ncbi:stage V sporulation protein AF [Alteribacillus persepolensis]|uniref:Stage V sporulation protein AF n=1 Tax=Alteribacillus persepolensis TaxID=568899 RepID=A0A1G7ZN43_9BACI|nr:spore germination protein [Alteribacillus persepolensis]SDH10182.1 stage V sporulation protein AF [Alteribacillus persepolensis]
MIRRMKWRLRSLQPNHHKNNQAEGQGETPISKDIELNEKILKERLGIGTSFDVGVRKLDILGKEIQIYFVTGLCDIEYIIEILKELMDLEARRRRTDNVKEAIENHLTHVQVEYKETLEDCIVEMLSGLIFILVEDEDEAFVIDVRNYPGRGPEEPDNEKVIRGARDGYTENIIENTGLTRRRIRDERLRHEIMRVGVRSKTDICIAYIDGIADPKLVDIIKKELENIEVDGLPMAEKVVEEYMVNQGGNPFPLVRYTERPDVAAVHLFEGHVVVMVDASPSVIITPTTLFHHVQHAEEYRQAPFIGTFVKWIRFFGMFASIFILPLWLLMVLEPNLLPDELAYIGPSEDANVSEFMQIFLADVGLELLRMAAIHTPSALTTALGLVAALLIGEIAIEVGLFTSEVVLYVALSAIGSYANPSYELGIAFKMIRLFLLVVVVSFGSIGFVIACTVIFLMLARIRSLNKPYLWPFLPFDVRELWQIAIRTTVPNLRKRPAIVDPQDTVKQVSE